MLRKIISREMALAVGAWLFILFATAVAGELYLRSSTPAALAMDFAQHNAAVQDEVGNVVNARLDWIGHIHYEGDEGWASFQVHIAGTRAHGRIEVTLHHQGDNWAVVEAQLVTDGGQTFDVAAPAHLVSDDLAVI